MSEKISNNQTYKELKNQAIGFSVIAKLYKLSKLFGYKNKKLDEVFDKLPELKKKLKELSEAPDAFNKYFSDRGWIAFESMNSDLLIKCVNMAKSNDIEKAEIELINYYKNEDLLCFLSGLKGIDAFRIRYSLLLKAYEDFKQERFYSCVPILLMMVDGVVNDIRKDNKGFFAEGADLTAWDSIAGHSTGLNHVARIFNKTRKKTTDKVITLPYRNGILHGKDLGFDNVFVATKLWATLFALGDWAKVVVEGKDVIPVKERKLSFKENINEFVRVADGYNEWQTKKKVIDKELSSWKPRQFKEVDFKNFIVEDNMPEKELEAFFDNLYKKKYGLIAKQLESYPRGTKSINKLAGEVREKLENIEIKQHKIVSVIDESPAVTEIKVKIVALSRSEQELTKVLRFRMICQDTKGKVQVRGNEDGKWHLLDMVLWDLYNFEWIKEKQED